MNLNKIEYYIEKYEYPVLAAMMSIIVALLISLLITWGKTISVMISLTSIASMYLIIELYRIKNRDKMKITRKLKTYI